MAAGKAHRAHPAWAWAGLGGALLSLLLALCSGLGYRQSWWSYAEGFRLLGIATALGGLAALLSLGAALANWGLHRRAHALSLAGLVLGLLTAGVPLQWKLAHDRLPRIHDITTDTVDPPHFVAAARLRRPGDHPPVHEGHQLAIRQMAGYPDIRPLVVRADPRRAYAASRAVLRDMGLRIVADAPAEGRIEAVATTLLYGFQDDFVVRVRAATPGARVDVRSMSRIGRSDLGKNAARIREFQRRLREQLPQ